MFYIHYDNFGQPNSFTGYKYRSKQKAIDQCNKLGLKSHVSELTKIISPWTGKLVDGFKKPCYNNLQTL
jgi:hypothetical protein